MDDRYLTLKKETTTEIKIKNSRFIGWSFNRDSVDAALEQLNKIRKQEYNANHNCYAYIVGIDPKEQTFKYSDDGEPSGTAGRPIYDYLAGTGVVNALVIVTRYFGGTKLGTGGLVKAYGEAAKAVLDKSGIKENFILDSYKLELEFPLYDRLQQLINRIGATQTDAQFSDNVMVELSIRKSLSEQLHRELVELTQGKGTIEKI